MDLQALLRRSHTVAIIGCSDNRFRASHNAATSLHEAAYLVIPINPKYQTVIGLACYADYEEVPDEIAIDIVNIFRNPAESHLAVQSVIQRAMRTGRSPVIWTQPGVSSHKSESAAVAAGLSYIRDKCIMVELAAMDAGHRLG